MTLELVTHTYWRNAITARCPIPEAAAKAQAYLWTMALQTKTPERLRDAALRHLSVARQEELRTAPTKGDAA
jgi:hypothetical protein